MGVRGRSSREKDTNASMGSSREAVTAPTNLLCNSSQAKRKTVLWLGGGGGLCSAKRRETKLIPPKALEVGI